MEDSPQIEDGFTRFANELLEAFCRTRIAGQGYQVVLCVARMTYGYGKKCDTISLSQISEMTGIKRHKLVPIIKDLSSMKILTVTNNGNRGVPNNGNTKPSTIGINKHFKEWNPVKKGGVPNNGNTLPVPNNGTTAVPNNGNLQRKKEIKYIPQNFLDISERFLKSQKSRHQNLVKITDKKIRDGADTLEKLVRIDGYDLEQIILPALRWAVEDSFWTKNILSLASLRNQSRNGEMKFQNILAAYSSNGRGKPSNPDPEWY